MPGGQREEDRQGARQRGRRDHLRPRGQRRAGAEGDRARASSRRCPTRSDGPQWWVRINPLGSEHHQGRSGRCSAAPTSTASCCPRRKAAPTSPSSRTAPATCPIHAIVTETAASLFGMLSYRDPKSPLAAMSWGAEDLSAALGASSKYDADGELELHLQAGALAVPGRRGRRRSPAGRRRLRRLQGRRRACAPKPKPPRREGFTGKLAIHPAQVAVINAAFTPSDEDIAPCRGNRRRVRGTARRWRAFGRRQNGRPAAPRAGQARTGTITIGGLRWPRPQNRNPRTLGGHAQADAAKGWGTDAPDQPLRPMDFERRALRPDDVAIKITYRRHLPQRPPHLPQRLGRDPLPGDPGPRDRRHRHRDRQRSHPPPRRRHRRGRLHGRQLHGVRPVPRRLGSLLPQGLRPDLQQRRLSRRHDHARAATPTISSSATISC